MEIGINPNSMAYFYVLLWRDYNMSDRGRAVVIFYTEILTGKVVLWCFFTSETSEKI